MSTTEHIDAAYVIDHLRYCRILTAEGSKPSARDFELLAGVLAILGLADGIDVEISPTNRVSIDTSARTRGPEGVSAAAGAAIELVDRFLTGFESPYGLELLLVTHTLFTKHGLTRVADMRAEVESWSHIDQNRLYTLNHLIVGLANLESYGGLITVEC